MACSSGGVAAPSAARAPLSRAWRDDAIRQGAFEPADVRAACVGALQRWARARHPAWGGRTPVAVIEAERRRAR